MMCTARGVLRWVLGLQEPIECGDAASAPPTLGDTTLLLLLAGLVLATMLILAGLVFARLVFAGLALAAVFVAGGVLLLLLAGAIAAGA